MHSLMSSEMRGYQVRFYDWAAHHPINSLAKRLGQTPNHVSVGIIDSTYQMWEPVVDMEGACWKPSVLINRAYGEPMSTYNVPLEASVRPLWHIVDSHKTSGVPYHLLWLFTGKVLPKPSNCLTLTQSILRELHWTTRAMDVPSLLKEVQQCS